MTNRPGTRTLQFSVDSELLRELGERLVGRPAIALAELIKNAYDADAAHAEVSLSEQQVVVSDDGRGMTEEEFRDYWMRIGSRHKSVEGRSRLGRPLTGSKGVGRLAVQFLGHKVRVITKARAGPALVADVDWDRAAKAGELTKAKATLRAAEEGEAQFPEGSASGTRIIVTGLKQRWEAEEVKTVARAIWMLQPPTHADREQMRFEVTFRSTLPGLDSDFERQMRAVLDIWHARVKGRLERRENEAGRPIGSLQLIVDFADGDTHTERLEFEHCPLHVLEYDIRIYDLVGRQRQGVSVKEARDYLEKFGNVSVFDRGFRMPFYGRETDWLDIEIDHSHRLTKSKMLPAPIKDSLMEDLPTMTRILGVVKIDTGEEENRNREQRPAGAQGNDYLQISITRDRLVDNAAYHYLKTLVRSGVDLYAVLQTRRKAKEKLKRASVDRLAGEVEAVEQALTEHRSDIPERVYQTLRSSVVKAARSVEARRTEQQAHIGLLGALATAGMAAAAYHHEIERHLAVIESALQALDKRVRANSDLSEFVATIRAAVEEIRRGRSLFSPFLEAESRESVERYRARALVRDVFDRLSLVLRGVQLDDEGLSDDVRLPPARYMEWTAILQNAFTNAYNAMLDSKRKCVRVSARGSRTSSGLRIEDTGNGVKLDRAAELFEPFVRYQRVSAERRRLGLGGTGLGLTIVRMIADKIGCRVGFVAPSDGYATCLEVVWRGE